MTPRRVLILGAETDVGRAAAEALAAAGASLALVSSTADANAAFAVQRFARKLGAANQAIDAANEAAVRVMLRQISKQLGGLDAVVCAQEPIPPFVEALARRELARSGVGAFVDARHAADIVAAVEAACA